jgi:hypothetical protein
MSYADNQRRPLEFEVRDCVLLKISPTRGVMQFEKEWEVGTQGCLNLDFIKYNYFS